MLKIIHSRQCCEKGEFEISLENTNINGLKFWGKYYDQIWKFCT